MPRALRPDPIDGWHHVMSRGVNRCNIFSSVEDRLLFGRLLARVAGDFEVEVHAYCLMGNHFHLLLRCPAGGLSAAMHRLLSTYARIVNDATGRTGHLFGERFCSRLVTDVGYLANVVRYIHLNPLDIAPRTDIIDYRWSSHRMYLGLRRRPEWLWIDTVLAWFDGPEGFDRFVRSTDSSPTGVVLAPPQSVLAAVDVMLAERSDAGPRHTPAQRRAVALVLADSMLPDGRTALLDALGIETAGARRTALSRARRLAIEEPVISEVAARTRALFELSALRASVTTTCA